MAATASIPAFAPVLSCSSNCFAACELSFSSIVCTGKQDRACSCCANFRAALVIAESLPSACNGRPTTRASGCQSAIISEILSQSGCAWRAFIVHRAVAVAVMLCPTAMPMRCLPKSNPSSVCKARRLAFSGRIVQWQAASGMPGIAGQQVEVDAQQCRRCLPALLTGCIKDNSGAGRPA